MATQQQKLVNPNDISLFDDVEQQSASLHGGLLHNYDEGATTYNGPPRFEGIERKVFEHLRPPTEIIHRNSPPKKILYVVQKPRTGGGNITRNLSTGYASPVYSMLNDVRNTLNYNEDKQAASSLHWDKDFVEEKSTTMSSLKGMGGPTAYGRRLVVPVPHKNIVKRMEPPRVYSKTTWTYKEMCLMALLNSEEPELLCEQIYSFLELHFFKRLTKTSNGDKRQKSSYKNSVRHSLSDRLFYKVEGANPKQTRYGINRAMLERSLSDCRANFEHRREEFLMDLTYPDFSESMLSGQLANVELPCPPQKILYPVRRVMVNQPQRIEGNNVQNSNYSKANTSMVPSYGSMFIINRTTAVKRPAHLAPINSQKFNAPEPKRVLVQRLPASSIRQELERKFRPIIPQEAPRNFNTWNYPARNEYNGRPPSTLSQSRPPQTIQTTQIVNYVHPNAAQEENTTQEETLGGSPTSSTSLYNDSDIGDLSEFFQM